MKRIPPELLHRLRNDIDITELIDQLGLPLKINGRRRTFFCPLCGDCRAGRIPGLNLTRCFHCRRSFNPIDLVMAARGYSFMEAVDYLRPNL